MKPPQGHTWHQARCPAGSAPGGSAPHCCPGERRFIFEPVQGPGPPGASGGLRGPPGRGSCFVSVPSAREAGVCPGPQAVLPPRGPYPGAPHDGPQRSGAGGVAWPRATEPPRAKPHGAVAHPQGRGLRLRRSAQHPHPAEQPALLPQPSPAPRAGSWPGRASAPCFRGPRERRGERAALGGHLPTGGTPGLSLTASPCSPRRTQTRRLHRSRTPSALRGAGGAGETEADSLPALPSAPGPGARPHGAPGCLCRRWGACLRTPFHGPRQGPSTCLLCPTRRRPPKSSRVPGRAS